MAIFLRDEKFENIVVCSNLLTQLDALLNRIVLSSPEYNYDEDPPNYGVFIIYTIRFDEKGYRVFKIHQLMEYFNQAQGVERVILQVDTLESIKTNRAYGSFLDLRFDNDQPSFLTVSSDDEAWMNNAFSSIREIIQKYRNKNGYVRNVWVAMLIQVFGVIFGFLLSLWAAVKISPSLNIENSFLISFLLILLIFSNLWTQIGSRLNGILNFTFPIIHFKREGKDQLHWMYQTLVGGIVVALILFLMGKAFEYIGTTLGTFIK